MFNYIKETIINSTSALLDVTGQLAVKRAGNYDLAKIVDGKVYKTPGTPGSKGVIKVTVPALTAESYRFTMFIATPSKSLSDYAMAAWGAFGKPILVEFEGSTTAADAAKNLVAALKLVVTDSAPFSVEVSGANVTITLSESWMVPEKPEIVKISDGSVVAATVALTSNVEEFATGKWLVENLRFPTLVNRRYAAPYADESPVDGVVYTQYSFEYKVEDRGIGGVSAVGQKIDSVVTIVFYVAPSAVSAFEAKLAGKTIEQRFVVTSTATQASAKYDGNTVAASKVTWSAAPSSVGTINASGAITKVAAGKLTVTGTYNGLSDSVEVTLS